MSREIVRHHQHLRFQLSVQPKLLIGVTTDSRIYGNGDCTSYNTRLKDTLRSNSEQRRARYLCEQLLFLLTEQTSLDNVATG